MNLKKISEKIFNNKKILIFLILANTVGFFIGLYFYSFQLSETHPILWLLVLDCPIAVLLFAFVCGLFYFGKNPPEILKIITSVYVIKYGFWTMLAIFLYWNYYIGLVNQILGVSTFILHLGMVIEGIFLANNIKPNLKIAFLTIFIFLLNDYSDYFFGTVTKIPSDYFDLLKIESFIVSVLVPIFIFLNSKINFSHNK
ncbi:MAG: DUF1405 domain-containing protein [Candidatus Nanoarchaeia archaeon]